MTLTDAEIAAIQHLPRDMPYLIAQVRQTQLSVARFAGGCKYNGHDYTYDPTDDTLIRDDVLKAVMAMRRLADKVERTARKEAAKAAQGGLL